MDAPLDAGLILAIALLAALVGGYLARWVHAPRIIGYLVMGLGLKLAAGQWYGARQAARLTEPLHLITDLTLGLILFTIGGVFEARRVSATKATLLRVSLSDVLGTFLCTALGCAAAAWTLPGMTLAHSITVGLLLGTVAIATAPAATYLVLREYEAKGPTTDHLLGLTGINNLLSIIAFSAVLMFCTWLGWMEARQAASVPLWLDLLFVSAGSMLLGAALGLALSLLHSRLALPEMILVFFAALFLLATGDDWLKETLGTTFNPMVTCLLMGVVFENLALDPRDFERTLETVSLPLFAVFFLLAGYNLHLDELPHLGWLGVAYIALRTLGKVGGVWLGVRRAGAAAMVRETAGLGLLCQAGVAIGLGASLVRHWPHELAGSINTIILSSVVLYELSGPLLLKAVVVRSGEVKVATLLRPGAHSSSSGPLSLIWEKIALFLSRSRRRPASPPESLTAKLLMRTNVRCLSSGAMLNEVIRFVESSRLHDFPVVDAERRYLGTVHFRSIRDLLYDPTFAHLITALDLADENAPVARPETPLSELLELFNQHNQGALPVVGEGKSKGLLGIVEQRDVLHALHRSRPEPSALEARKGVLIVGAGPLARALAHELKITHPVRLLDTNNDHCAAARSQGLEALHGNALHEEGLSVAGLARARALIALTPNEEVNLLSAKLGRETFRVPEVFVLLTHSPGRIAEVSGAEPLFGGAVDLALWDLWISLGQTERVTLAATESTRAGLLLASLTEKRASPLLPLALERDRERSVYRESRKLGPGDELIALRRRSTRKGAENDAQS